MTVLFLQSCLFLCGLFYGATPLCCATGGYVLPIESSSIYSCAHKQCTSENFYLDSAGLWEAQGETHDFLRVMQTYFDQDVLESGHEYGGSTSGVYSAPESSHTLYRAPPSYEEAVLENGHGYGGLNMGYVAQDNSFSNTFLTHAAPDSSHTPYREPPSYRDPPSYEESVLAGNSSQEGDDSDGLTAVVDSPTAAPTEKGLLDDYSSLSPASNQPSSSVQVSGECIHKFRGKRPQYLAALFREKRSISFGDVRATEHYRLCSEYIFESDILRFMFHGADIRLHEGRYHYYGEVGFPQKMTLKEIAVAMFNILLGGEKTSFGLIFKLYRAGFRGFSPDFLDSLEFALAVGRVHPDGQGIYGSFHPDLYDQTVEIWHKVQESGEKYLYAPSEEHAVILKKRRCQQAIVRLCDLCCDGDFDELVRLKASQSPAQQEGVGSTLRKRSKIMSVLAKNTNKVFSIEELCKEVHTSGPNEPKIQRTDTGVFLRSVLRLALSNPRIVYNKDKKTVVLMKEKVSHKPSENANLLTMLYDLLRQYNGRVIHEELAYYAKKGGYWPEGFVKGGSALFVKEINFYKNLLAVQGHISASCCGKSGYDIERQRAIWRVITEEKTLRDFNYYKRFRPDLTTHDWDVIKRINTMQDSREMTVFRDHVRALDAKGIPCAEKRLPQDDWCIVLEKGWNQGNAFLKMQKLIGILRPQPILAVNFWDLCKTYGVTMQSEMWAIAGHLTRRTEGGRLLYNPATCMFSWDNDGCVPQMDGSGLIAEVFSLQYRYPDMSFYALDHMLKQDGFYDIGEREQSEILDGFRVLGLLPLREGHLMKARGFLNSILTSHKKGTRTWAERIAVRVASWAHGPSMQKLWQTYQELRDGEVPSKRMRLTDYLQTPEDVIRSEIPELYKILQKIDASLSFLPDQ